MRGKTRRKEGIFSLPTYVINLKERNDRWGRFIEQPALTGFKDLHRFGAANGKRLNYKRDKRISMRTKINITRNYRRSHYEIATLGAVGASLSHIGIWKKFVNSGASKCIIMEDDAVLVESELDEINAMTPPAGWGIWLLGCYLPNVIEEPLRGSWSRVYNFTAAHAYILTRAAALKLLQQPFPIESHIEYYMTGTALLKDIDIVRNNKVNIEFFRKPDGPRAPESNTSQHIKNGCPTCNMEDDYRRMYKGATRKTKNGIKVKGIIESQQENIILNFKNIATREDSVHP
jgi:hypothetical protein